MSLIKPKRHFSQNFLIDENVAEAIVAVGNYSRNDTVVEIGPGYGALTNYLENLLEKATLVEVDRDAIFFLHKKFSPEFAHVIEGDFLALNLSDLGCNLRLIGNLPYHISSPILLHVNRDRAKVKDAVFMLQKEVVDRLVASPGTKEFGKLTVALQLNWSMERVLDVPPSAFKPAPKVWSSVVYMRRRTKPLQVNVERFERILFAAFSKRRKTLRNALREFFSESDFLQCSVDPRSRPETLSVEQYVQLANFTKSTPSLD
jgi:16S rRNA (adenine1518-N6/adenine1519-N6)-dimethyltransferase